MKPITNIYKGTETKCAYCKREFKLGNIVLVHKNGDITCGGSYAVGCGATHVGPYRDHFTLMQFKGV